MADGQARVGVQGTDNKEAEEERLERRLREIMGDTGVEGMADINLKQEAERSGQASSVRRRSARGATTTSPIQESDMVKHYKSLFFARNGAALKATQGGNRGVPPISTNGYTAPSETATNGVGPAQRLTSKYKTNIVPPHMKRPKAQSKSAISRKIHSSFMSSLPPEQIPSYFSAPALARMEPKAHSHETEKKEGEPQSQGETGAREGKSEEKSLGPEEEVVAKAELEQAKLELEEAKERLKLYQDQGERVKELESQIADLNETKLDAKGMSVSMQRQLTQLTGERQDMLLVSGVYGGVELVPIFALMMM